MGSQSMVETMAKQGYPRDIPKLCVCFFVLLLIRSLSTGEQPTQNQIQARFYYDLGPAEVDVSSYPREQQHNYSIFVKTCSQCHTLARPINAPIAARKDWERYVRRMHLRAQARPAAKIQEREAKAVVDFLTYDSAIRKAGRRQEFEMKTEELRRLFAKVQKERTRLQLEEGKKKSRSAPRYMGTP